MSPSDTFRFTFRSPRTKDASVPPATRVAPTPPTSSSSNEDEDKFSFSFVHCSSTIPSTTTPNIDLTLSHFDFSSLSVCGKLDDDGEPTPTDGVWFDSYGGLQGPLPLPLALGRPSTPVIHRRPRRKDFYLGGASCQLGYPHYELARKTPYTAEDDSIPVAWDDAFLDRQPEDGFDSFTPFDELEQGQELADLYLNAESYEDLSGQSAEFNLHQEEEGEQQTDLDKHERRCFHPPPVSDTSPADTYLERHHSKLPPSLHTSLISPPTASSVPVEGFEILSGLASGGFSKTYIARQLPRGPTLCFKVITKPLVAGRLNSNNEESDDGNDGEANGAEDVGYLRSYQQGAEEREERRNEQRRRENARQALREVKAYRRLAETKDAWGKGFVMDLDAAMHDERNLYLAMELMMFDLFHVIQNKLPMRRMHTQRWIAQAAAGIDCLHRAGLIHRDIKPENLLLDHQLNIRISDLGCAYIHGPNPVKSWEVYSDSIFGTYSYMAPEVYVNRHLDVVGTERMFHGPMVDFWSLGCVMFDLEAEGCDTLFKEEEDLERYAAWDGTESYFEFAGLSEQAEEVIAGLLQVNPMRRFGVRDLERLPYFQNYESPETTAFDLIESRAARRPVEDFKHEAIDLYREDHEREFFEPFVDLPADGSGSFDEFGWVNPKGIWRFGRA